MPQSSHIAPGPSAGPASFEKAIAEWGRATRLRGRVSPFRPLGKWDSVFPAGLARAAIDAFAPPGTVTLDPFCESPVPAAQAVAAGHSVAAVARNWRTWALLSAAAGAVEGRHIVKRIVELRNDMFYGDPAGTPAIVRTMTNTPTLSRLAHLRDNLDVSQKADVVIAALVCHALDHRQVPPPAGTDGAGQGEDDLFDTLLELTRSAFPWKADDRRPAGPSRSPSVHVWYMGDDFLTFRLTRLAELARPCLALGQAPIFDEKRPSLESPQVDWRLQAPLSARQVPFAHRISDIPGYLNFMTLLCAHVCAGLPPDAALALWVVDGRLKGKGRETIPLAERLGRRIENDIRGMRLVDLASPSGEDATGNGRRSGRLLVMRKLAS